MDLETWHRIADINNARRCAELGLELQRLRELTTELERENLETARSLGLSPAALAKVVSATPRTPALGEALGGLPGALAG